MSFWPGYIPADASSVRALGLSSSVSSHDISSPTVCGHLDPDASGIGRPSGSSQSELDDFYPRAQGTWVPRLKIRFGLSMTLSTHPSLCSPTDVPHSCPLKAPSLLPAPPAGHVCTIIWIPFAFLPSVECAVFHKYLYWGSDRLSSQDDAINRELQVVPNATELQVWFTLRDQIPWGGRCLTVRSLEPSKELAGWVTLGTSWTSPRSSHLSRSLPRMCQSHGLWLDGVFQGGASEGRCWSACSGKWTAALLSVLPWPIHPWETQDWVQLWSRHGERWPSAQLWFKAVHVDLAQTTFSTGDLLKSIVLRGEALRRTKTVSLGGVPDLRQGL